MTHPAEIDKKCTSSSNPIQVAKQKGWRTAACVLAKQSEDPASELEYITTERCADFRFLLPVSEDDSVLDICGGSGSTTAAFARICKHVFSLHSSSEKLAFTGVRCDQEELNNVTLIQSNPIDIPLPAQSCQVALLTDPLACGQPSNGSTPSRDRQLQILKSVHRVLIPGGSLYLNIDNRFSYRYLLGTRVPPTNLRFISLLPNSLANYYSRRMRGIDYPAVAQSLGEVNALLKQAGFVNPDPLYPIPGHKKFRFITDFNSQVITDYMISRLQLHSGFNRTQVLFARFAASLGVLRWSSPGISIITYKG